MLTITRIQIDYQTNPVGIEKVPQFGWQIESDRKNVFQEKYCLQIAKDAAFKQLVYNSGMVESDESAHVIPNKFEMESLTKYYVRVRMSDGVEESEFSDTWFVSALVHSMMKA